MQILNRTIQIIIFIFQREILFQYFSNIVDDTNYNEMVF